MTIEERYEAIKEVWLDNTASIEMITPIINSIILKGEYPK